MSAPNNKFEGWAGMDKDSVKGNLKFIEYEPKTFCDDDIELEVLYCGICASDLHTLSSGWGDMSKLYPQVVGHEVVGKVVRVGDAVKSGIKVGDIAGCGAQCDSCQECNQCEAHNENYCNNGHVGTYAGIFYRDTPAKGQKSYGGYANYWRGPSRFVVSIPDNVDPAEAAPMLCGGATVFTPLKQYGAGKKAKDVGIIGIGGLGHFALLFAKAMGANVTAITHSASKDEDAKKMGATTVIHTGDDTAKAIKGHERSLDLIVCSSNDPNMDLNTIVKLLRPHGTFCLVGAPESGDMKIHPFTLLMSNVHLSGSAIGSPDTIREMLKFVGDHDVHPWIKKYPLDKVNEAIVSQHKGEARYRYVLVNEKNGGKL